MSEQPIDFEWTGCYDGGWQGLITPESFSHPAKFSRALIGRIYKHCVAEGWVKPGDIVLDPFGGVALGALDAMHLGLNWVGCELEPKFVALGGENIKLWQARFGHVAGWGSARLLQGDSRHLAKVVAGAGLAVSSPPYAEIATGAGGLNTKPGKDGQQSGRSPHSPSQDTDQKYGTTPGQLSALPATPRGLSLALSSPPYSEGLGHGTPNIQKYDLLTSKRLHGGDYAYGSTPGQLGAMPTGQPPVAVVSSPPYRGKRDDGGMICGKTNVPGFKTGESQFHSGHDYGETEGQLGQAETAADFWSASRLILEQVYQVLAPGGHACWVLKRFVRAGRIVEFPDQWLALCESVGFRLTCRHRAMLVVDTGEQRGLWGGHKRLSRQRKSFFRKLAEAHGSPPVDWEDVICFEKPL